MFLFVSAFDCCTAQPMEFELTEEQKQIKTSVREFAEAEIAPHVMEWDEAQHFPIELQPKLAELGLTGVLFPEEYGGAGMGYIEYATIIEELSRVDGSVGISVAAHNSLCSNHIYQYGSEAKKQKLLVPLANGKHLGAWGLTEPSAGSDVSGTRSTAVRKNGGWIVNGSKNFITHAIHADTCVAVAVTDRSKRSKGITAFIFEKGMKGFSPSKKENKLGLRASETAIVVFEDCLVPDENRIGDEGMGFANAMEILDGGRISIAALAVGIAQGAYESALRYSGERQQFGKPIREFQAIQFKLADMATQIDAEFLMTKQSMIERINAGEVTAVARAISLVEDGGEQAAAIMKEIFPHTGRALVIGITGSPGSGKSTLVDKLASFYRKQNERVGIVAVDPSSPFTGGAILGDRIRMQTLSLDQGVFIRSMATRGNLGGLARGTVDAVAILDAAGYQKILVETVGVGQDEVEIVKTADVCVVVLVPGMGDDVQTMKAGIMEIGDVLVLNKADREGALRAEKELQALLTLAVREDTWQPTIVKTVATESKGIEELATAIEQCREFQKARPETNERRRAIARWRILELLREQLVMQALNGNGAVEKLDRLAAEVAAKERDPYSAVEELIK